MALLLPTCAAQPTHGEARRPEQAPTQSPTRWSLHRPCGVAPEGGIEPSCLPGALKGGLIAMDEQRHLRIYEKCVVPRGDNLRNQRFASNSTVFVERYGSRALNLEEIKMLRNRQEAFGVLAQVHGLSRLSRSTCSDSMNAVSVPCIKIGFDAEDLDVMAVASLLGDAYADADDSCFVVEVTNGVPRPRLQ